MSEQLLKRLQEQAAFYAKSSMKFVSDELLNSIYNMDSNAIDELDIGVVGVDDNGTIIIYNKLESLKANVEQKIAIGKNFFTQIAPCTNNSIFYGTFKNSIKQPQMDFLFPYTFTYKMKPTPVKVHLYKNNIHNKNINWIFIKWN